MSYYPPPGPGQQPYGGAPPPQPGGYGQQSHSPYPPTGQPYPPPMNQQYPPQQPYGGGAPPPGGYPPHQQQQWAGAPPPAGQYPNSQPQWGAQPGQPPQQQWGAPVPGQHGPPPGQQWGAPSPQPGYPQQMPPAQPTPGYTTNAGMYVPTDMNQPAAEIRDSMKGFGTNEAKLIAALARVPDAPHMLKLRATYNERFRRDLIKDITSETSSYFRDTLLALVRGPLEQDCHLVYHAIKGIGTKEVVLDDVLCGRSNADLIAIKQAYQRLYHQDLVADVKGDLSMKTLRMYEFILAGQRPEESSPVIPQQVDQDVNTLYHATEAKMSIDQIAVCQLLTTRSDGQIRAINQAYLHKYRRSLDEVVRKEFSGHMEHALRLYVSRAVDRAKSDADELEAAMAGIGTKDELLLNRVVRAHWDRNHLAQVKGAYKQFHKMDLAKRIQGETRGDFEKVLVALVQGDVPVTKVKEKKVKKKRSKEWEFNWSFGGDD